MTAVQTSDIIYLLLPVVFGMLSSFLKKRNARKNASQYQPPGWVFGIVWPILYIMLGISIFIQWRSANRKYDTNVCLLLTIFVLLNTWWFLFGGEHLAPTFSFIFILFTTILIYFTALHLYTTNNKITAYLALPLAAWMTYASFLTHNSNWYITLK